jgi:hypothetical protein
MIYICADASGKLSGSEAFTLRGLDKFTMGKIGDIVCIGKADNEQLAYSGYKSNIEAFLFATAVGKKVLIASGHFPIPVDYTPTTPLTLPRTLFKLAKKPTSDFLERMKSGLEKYGIEDVYVGKGDPSFVVDKPGFTALRTSIAQVSLPRGPSVEGVAQLEATVFALRIYQCVDLFLRTNTYAYKGEAEESSAKLVKRGIDTVVETRINSYFYRPGYDQDTKVPRRADDVSVRKGEKEAYPEEPVDLTPHLDGELQSSSVVLVAKPSRMPATSSYGRPSDVPFVPGILFPYFKGLLSGDTAGFRELVAKLFYRNLGELGKDNRQAFKDFRAGVGSFPTTEQGVILCHVLKGIDLALQTQTHLFLLIEQETYHGFCLLGEKFAVFAHGTWERPGTPEELRDELKSIRSHSASLEKVAELLGQVLDRNGDTIVVDSEGIDSTVKLADVLAKVDIDEKEEEVKELVKALQTLSFPTTFRTYKPEYICQALDILAGRALFPEDVPIYLGTDWSKMDTVEYKAFAMFGPRGFSFRNSTGIEIKVPGQGDSDPFKQKEENGKWTYPRLILGEKSIPACIAEWNTFVARGCIKMDVTERAGGSRNRVFTDKSRDVIWDHLKLLKGEKLIGVGKETVPQAEKRTHAVAFGKGDFDTVLFD